MKNFKKSASLNATSETMGAETISKNGACPKSLMSREKIYSIVFCCLVAMLSFSACGGDDDADADGLTGTKWTASYKGVSGLKCTLSFKSAGQCTMTLSVGYGTDETFDGTYTYDEPKVSVSLDWGYNSQKKAIGIVTDNKMTIYGMDFTKK